MKNKGTDPKQIKFLTNPRTKEAIGFLEKYPQRFVSIKEIINCSSGLDIYKAGIILKMLLQENLAEKKIIGGDYYFRLTAKGIEISGWLKPKKRKDSNIIQEWKGYEVIDIKDWDHSDFTKLPNKYTRLTFIKGEIPEEWYDAWISLLEELKDSHYGGIQCCLCIVHKFKRMKGNMESWVQNVKGSPEFYKYLNEYEILKKAAGGRMCENESYFNCPYGKERSKLPAIGLRARSKLNGIRDDKRFSSPDFDAVSKAFKSELGSIF